MIQITNNLLVGTVAEIPAHPEWAFVNLAHTYHYEIHKWTRNDGIDHTIDKCYVVCTENPMLLSLNWVDSPNAALYDYNGQGVARFHQIFDFIDQSRGNRPVGIVCNKGESRSPSIAMAYLAKRTNILSRPVIAAEDLMKGADPVALINEAKDFEKPTYALAREKFERIYSSYYPAGGITTFLIDHWDEL